MSETHLLARDHAKYDGGEARDVGEYIFRDHKRRTQERGSVGFYVQTDIITHVFAQEKFSYDHCMWVKVQGEGNARGRYICSVYMPRDQDGNM